MDIDSIKQDLVKWSGLPEKLVSSLVDRKYDELEYKLFNLLEFKAEENLHWYYRTSALYIFQTVCHPVWPILDQIERGPILDYGGGCGNNFFHLLEKGFKVDFFDISYSSIDYVKWRIQHKGYSEYDYEIISPFHGANFDPISCLFGKRYGTVIFQSVLEHIHDYETLLVKAINSLNYEGLIFEEAPFGSGGDSYHLSEKKSIGLIMEENGMVSIRKHIWRKKVGG